MKHFIAILCCVALLTGCRRQHTTKTKTDSTVTTASEATASWEREVTRQFTFLPPGLTGPGNYNYHAYDPAGSPAVSPATKEASVPGSILFPNRVRHRVEAGPVLLTETIRERGTIRQQAETKKQVHATEKQVVKEKTGFWPRVWGALLLIIFLLVVWCVYRISSKFD